MVRSCFRKVRVMGKPLRKETFLDQDQELNGLSVMDEEVESALQEEAHKSYPNSQISVLPEADLSDSFTPGGYESPSPALKNQKKWDHTSALPENPAPPPLTPRPPIGPPSPPQNNLPPQGAARDMALPRQMVLKQSAHLEMAQKKIFELQSEIQNLRKQNEKLRQSSDVFQKNLNQVKAQYKSLSSSHREMKQEYEQENKRLSEIIETQMKTLNEREKQDHLQEKNLSESMKQISMREEELQNRLEIMGEDRKVLLQKKDRQMVRLKGQVRALQAQLVGEKKRCQDILEKLHNFRTQSRKAVQALRMALGLFHGEEALPPLKEPEEDANNS